jgi:hypothetical protein
MGRRAKSNLVVALWIALAAACKRSPPEPDRQADAAASSAAPEPSQGGPEQARKLLLRFVQPDADTDALSRELIPRDDDYAAVFAGDAAKRARDAYRGPFAKGMLHIQPRPGQRVVRLWSATPAQLAARSGDAAEFPGGYQRIASHFVPTITVYRFSFSGSDGKLPMTYDGLVYVHGHWAMFPKPWRVVR